MRFKVKIKIILILSLLAMFSLYAIGNSSNGEDSLYSDFQGLYQLVENSSDYTLIDVRTGQEYGDSHIPTAINIPYNAITSDQPLPAKDSLIIVYCRSGRRSGIAKQSLVDLGFTNVHDFGAVTRWKDKFVKGQYPGNL